MSRHNKHRNISQRVARPLRDGGDEEVVVVLEPIPVGLDQEIVRRSFYAMWVTLSEIIFWTVVCSFLAFLVVIGYNIIKDFILLDAISM